MAKLFHKIKKKVFLKTRKQIRKEKRQQKKIKRNEYYLKKNKTNDNNAASTNIDKATPKRVSYERNVKPIPYESNTVDKQLKQNEKDAVQFKKLQKRMKLERTKQLLEASRADDEEIRSLEKKLKLNRRKRDSLPKSFISEGLDYLLEICDYDKYKESINLEKELNASGDEFEDDLDIVTGSKKSKTKPDENDKVEAENEDDGDSDASENEYDDGINDDDSGEYDSELSAEEDADESDDVDLVPPAKGILLKREKLVENNAASQTRKRVTFNINDNDEEPKIPAAKKDVASRMKNLKDFVANVSKDKLYSDGKAHNVVPGEKQNVTSRMKKLQNFVSKESKRNSCSNEDFDNDFSGNDSDGSSHHSDDGEDHSQKRKKQQSASGNKKLREDIYGRLRDEEGNVIETNTGKYVPPQLRLKLHDPVMEDSESIQRLTKHMKGCLNRLTERNMHSIATQMEDLYMKHSRNDANYVFLKLIMDSLISPILSPERIVIEHAMLISLLHANVGTEIGAFILQRLVEEMHKMLEEDGPIENKRIDNLTMFLCQLYNFKVFHACLIFELLNKFVEKFQEKQVELILLVLKNVGFVLRKDDSTALKELIINIRNKANESPELKESPRVRFMLDTLLAVKNNNVLKVQNYDPSYVEHLKKIGKSLLRPGKFVTELKITMEDLLNAETKGKWWIIGSAWSGDFGKNIKADESSSGIKQFTFDQKILNLAKKQRMNTDVRRNIFCILMTAEDFIDAFEKLMKLGLKGQQYQEVVHVLMHCLMKEKKYNPYYAFLAEQFCSTDRKYQLALQFSAWDKFKEINSFNRQQITNLAQFLAYLFVERKLPLSILKALQFTEMNKPMVKLIRQILLAILLAEDEKVVVDVFSRISKSEKLFMLREGLLLFLHHFVLKNVKKNATDDHEEKLDLLPKRIELAVNSIQGSTFDF